MKILAASLVAAGLLVSAVPAANAAGVAIHVGGLGVAVGHPDHHHYYRHDRYRHGRYNYHNHWYSHRSYHHHGWHYY